MTTNLENNNSYNTPARVYAKGIGDAVADRTINRKLADGSREKWEDVAKRVATGNSMLHPVAQGIHDEFEKMHHHLRQASILMSGRHLQHGDETQPTRPQEVFTNCSTSASTFLSFYLLLNGSGVGRSYDDAMIVADFKNLPLVIPVIDMSHADCRSGEINIPDKRSCLHLYSNKEVVEFEVEDSREGWAKAIEVMETMAFEGVHRDKVLLIDFSKVRPRGAPIAGMQNRPASGPGPIISAVKNISGLRDAEMAPWRAAMYADHYSAECVLVGGARRAARMATKSWTDATVLDFIQVKRGGFLWSSNNSVMVDEDFWDSVIKVEESTFVMSTKDPILQQNLLKVLVKKGVLTEKDLHAHRVFIAICEASYFDKTGEPGLINADKLTWKNEGLEVLHDGNFAESERYKLSDSAKILNKNLVKAWEKCLFKAITNPCVPGDTPILTKEGYVEIESVVGKSIEVWNGKEFSEVTPFSTGINDTLNVNFSNGTSLRCTPSHKFMIADESRIRKEVRVEAKNLLAGMKLFKYSMPNIVEGTSFGDDSSAYSQGFYSGDGNTGLNYSWLYFTKYMCQSRLTGSFGEEIASSRRKTWTHGLMLDKTWVPIKGDVNYCMNWLAGLLDSDGTVCTDREGGNSYQITSTNKEFLLSIRLMLTRFGTQATVSADHEEGLKLMPDGRGGSKEYECKKTWKLVICGFDAWNLNKVLGLKTTRLKYDPPAEPNRSAARFVTVVSVEEDIPCETFCFTELKNHTGTFNGIVTSNCGEVVLGAVGGYCVIADIVPYHAASKYRKDGRHSEAGRKKEWDSDAEDAFRTATRALIRTNLMDCLYAKEVKRTNRIGVGITGLHEYAWARFGYGWKDIVDEEKSKDFWETLSVFSNACVDEARKYSKELGVVMPHTVTTIKPAGTTSKLFGLTEGAHLPSMREYLRWVQFRNDDPLIADYEKKGYPVRKLRSYNDTTIVGFPTAPTICTLGMGDKLITAAEATPEEQYQYLRLMEKYWIGGFVEGRGTHSYGNQVSYTLKYFPDRVGFKEFMDTLLEGQSTIKCCSVMPQTDTTAYEYQPEQPVTKHEFEQIAAAIQEEAEKEDIGFEHVDCSSGACPIDFNK